MKNAPAAALLAAVLTASGCASSLPSPPTQPPSTADASPTRDELAALPPPARKITVAVYGYDDQTGQLKPGDNVSSYSKAVTQGAASILIKALQDAGDGRWFSVVERARLDDLLKERQIISEMRKRYGEPQRALPPMRFAGLLLQGGIVAFDSNTQTGGAGARYLGIGAQTQYRQDTVAVYLRATSTQTGEIVKSVMARKTIASVSAGASLFRFVSFKQLLEAEAGYTRNEPGHEAIKQAIEKAVYALVLEGADSGLWAFRNADRGRRLIEQHRAAAPAGPNAARAAAATATPSSLFSLPARRPELSPRPQTRARRGAFCHT